MLSQLFRVNLKFETHPMINKLLLGIIILATFWGCKKGGFLNYRNEDSLYGTWEITRYKKDGNDLISNSTFTRNDLVFQDGDYLSKFYSFSKGQFCNDTLLFFDIQVSLDSKTMSFEQTGVCNHPDAIDPLYYQNGSKLEDKWHIKSFSKNLFVLSNSLTERDNEIEIMFEKAEK